MKNEKYVSVILSSGGIGERMQSKIPKQYLTLGDKPIARYSFEIFSEMPEVAEIIIVCDPSYHHIFASESHGISVKFAEPGKRRQDSVFNGFKMIDKSSKLVCIHDAVRPFITADMARRILHAASETGAATAGMPVKFTVKECQEDGLVKKTLPRSLIWEIQTPQVIKPELLKLGFKMALDKDLTVTDDVLFSRIDFTSGKAG